MRAVLVDRQAMNPKRAFFDDRDCTVQGALLDRGEHDAQPMTHCLNSGLVKSDQDDAGTAGGRHRQQVGIVQIHRNDDPLIPSAKIEDGLIGGCRVVDVAGVQGIMAFISQPLSDARRDRHVQQQAHDLRGVRRQGEGFFAGEPCGVLDGLANVFRFEVGVVLQDLLSALAGSQEIQDQVDGDSQAPNTGPAAELLGIYRDAREALHGHTVAQGIYGRQQASDDK